MHFWVEELFMNSADRNLWYSNEEAGMFYLLYNNLEWLE